MPETTDDELPGDGREAPPLAIPLRAGPLRLVFDRGELRWIRLGEREVLRGIYAAVREAGWATVPARLFDLELDAEPDAFRIRFVARHARGQVRLDWQARIEGRPDGTISYTIDGAAGSTFLRNRIGFCVLHPAAECAGEPCTLETTDGARSPAAFPRLVSPHQPFLGLRAIAHEPIAGVVAEVRMEGDTFETEDQRNWSDASFKTYCTPLALPFPAEVKEGTRIRQSVELRLTGETRELVREAVSHVPGAVPQKRNSTEPVVVAFETAAAAPLPALGLGGGGLVELDGDVVARLAALRLSHLRADLALAEPGWEEALARAAANGARLGVPLELALELPDEPRAPLEALARRAGELRPRVGRWLLFHARDHVTREGDAALARELLGPLDAGAAFAGGSERYFAELNRKRPPTQGLDAVVFSLNPQVHAFDDATLFENLASLHWLAETARSFSDGLPLGITPATLRPRHDPRPESSRTPGEPPFTDDPRQATALAAAWALALVGSAARAGFSTLTLFEPTGPRGLMLEGRAFPAYHALAELAQLEAEGVVSVRSRRPERIQAFGVRRGPLIRLFLANVTADVHPVRVEGMAGAVRRAPLGAGDEAEEGGTEFELAPRSVVRLDVAAS